MVNISLKEDEGRFLIESMLKRLSNKAEPTLLKVNMAKNIISKFKKAYAKNKNSPVFLIPMVKVLSTIGASVAARLAAEQISKAMKKGNKK